LESLQRLANGMAVDAQVLGEGPLGGDPVAGRQLAGEDLLAQPPVHLGGSEVAVLGRHQIRSAVGAMA